MICGFIIIFTGVYLLDSIARSGSESQYIHDSLSTDEEQDEDEEFLMGEAALLDQHESSSLHLSGLNHESDDDIELVSRPRSRQI